jgi:hypothetical protein
MTVAPATVGYYEDLVDTTFGGDIETPRDYARLFLAPGVRHCRGGVGPDTWDTADGDAMSQRYRWLSTVMDE